MIQTREALFFPEPATVLSPPALMYDHSHMKEIKSYRNFRGLIAL